MFKSIFLFDFINKEKINFDPYQYLHVVLGIKNNAIDEDKKIID
jgi:hypothetical protein